MHMINKIKDKKLFDANEVKISLSVDLFISSCSLS